MVMAMKSKDFLSFMKGTGIGGRRQQVNGGVFAPGVGVDVCVNGGIATVGDGGGIAGDSGVWASHFDSSTWRIKGVSIAGHKYNLGIVYILLCMYKFYRLSCNMIPVIGWFLVVLYTSLSGGCLRNRMGAFYSGILTLPSRYKYCRGWPRVIGW